MPICRISFTHRLGLPAAALLAAITLALPAALAQPGASAAAPDLQNTNSPSAKLAPSQVVRAQLLGLKNNDDPATDAGIARTRRFSSPQNRRQTGPYERFRAMIHLQYAELLNHREHTIISDKIDGDSAVVAVVVIARNGETFGYLFHLSRLDEYDCSGCWFTDGVEVSQAGTAI